jgi:uncharacterized protein YbjT (DUF2867 family)
MTILVTGGTGRLGRTTVDALRAHGHEVRVLSRRPGDGHAVADLSTGEGLASALAGVDAVVHLATTRSKDIGQTRMLLDALAGTGTHLVFISIVGVDEIPFPYYRDKWASEQAIEASEVPHTIIRVTQFHGFVEELLDPQRRLPVTFVIPGTAQTIHIPEVAERLVELVEAGPAGRVADLGGPEVLTLAEYARQWQRAHGIHRPVWVPRLPGGFARAVREGRLTSGLPGAGRVTFREYLAEKVAR